MPATLVVPADAIVDTGLRKTLFVDRGNGYLEPRQVEIGERIGDRIEITKGLTASERIVISGNFLINSESQLKSAAEGMSAPAPAAGTPAAPASTATPPAPPAPHGAHQHD